MMHKPAHFSTYKTYYSSSRHFYWEKMYKHIQKYVSSCFECQTNKNANTVRQGLLQPHEIPGRTWELITKDFVTGFPTTDSGYDCVVVVVEKLSKRIIFIPIKKTVKTPEFVCLFIYHVFSKHGMPKKIILDQDSLFKSNYFREIADILNVELNVATKDHPQTDG